MDHAFKVREGERTPPRTVKLEAHAPYTPHHDGCGFGSIQGDYGSIRANRSRDGSYDRGAEPLLDSVKNEEENRRMQKRVDFATHLSIFANLLLFGIKLYSVIVTGSVSVLASLVDR